MRVDHLGIAVRSIESARGRFEPLADGPASPPELVEGQGVRVAFLDVGGTHLELLEPVRPDSAVGRFLEKRGEGPHHVAFHVASVADALDQARKRGARLIDEAPRAGARGRRVGFVHPSSMNGVLVEFVEGP